MNALALWSRQSGGGYSETAWKKRVLKGCTSPSVIQPFLEENIHKVSFLIALAVHCFFVLINSGVFLFLLPVGRFLSDSLVWGLPFIRVVLCSVRNEVFGA